jgi:hypothetical protein
MFRFVRPLSIPSNSNQHPQLTISLQHKPLDIITLFHKPSLPTSMRALTLLKQASASASETSTEDQATSSSPGDFPLHAQRRSPFEYNVTEQAPTPDELKLILDYMPEARAPGDLVEGARDRLDALRRCKEDPGRFKRPVVGVPVS